ncbi:hypothetical protein FHS85_001378 [Rhodoligotrophos appendicifer]|uniref:GNAT family acetyltransferase n=1 Tax=Rhodoligotrophos appendicifer TaxID=987056 RepID=UPI0011855961|nr:GNAT family acetyltransferase [Rhodoligotrophos appendicifer]
MSPGIIFRPAAASDIETIVAIWRDCDLVRPWNDPYGDIALASGKANSDILLGIVGGEIAATVMVGHDGHRGIVYYVAVAPRFRQHRYGTATMRAAESWLVERGIAKLNLLIRPENEAVQRFYESLGYEVEPRLSMARRLLKPS